jgi:predicted nucleic acid-binding protein
VNDEFQVWALVLGLALGAALAWFALGSAGHAADLESHETDDERALEADWLARELTRQGHPVDADTLEAALALHHDLAAGRTADAARRASDTAGRSGGAEQDGLGD